MNKLEVTRTERGIEVYLDGSHLPPEPSQEVWNKSPDGFNIGYGGSGPAQLALAIMLRFVDKDQALKLFQAFKWEYLANQTYRTAKELTLYIDIEGFLEKYKKV